MGYADWVKPVPIPARVAPVAFPTVPSVHRTQPASVAAAAAAPVGNAAELFAKFRFRGALRKDRNAEAEVAPPQRSAAVSQPPAQMHNFGSGQTLGDADPPSRPQTAADLQPD